MRSEIIVARQFEHPVRKITGIHGTLAACELDRSRTRRYIRYGRVLDIRNRCIRECFNRRIRMALSNLHLYLTTSATEGVGKRKLRRREQFRRAICQKIVCDDNHYQSLVPRRVLR